MALINPCDIELAPSNTGAECNDAMKATAMVVMVPKAAKWQTADLADFTAYMNTQLHAAPSTRWFAIFGNSAPVKNITESNENDVIETHEDGSVSFIRYGMYNRTLVTTEGGMTLAAHLMAMRQNYAFIEIDIVGNVAMMKNSDGSYSGFPVNLAYAPAPILANLKTTYKNQFMLSFSPQTYVKLGKVLASDANESILGLRGLFDTEVLEGDGVESITKLYVKVKTIAGGSDLVALYPVALPVVGNFVVTNANGTANTPSAAAVVGGEIEFTGTFLTGTNITVSLAAPSVLKAAGIEGYEGVTSAVISIP